MDHRAMRDTILRANETVPSELVGHRLELLEGAVPRELRGTLFRNGPGRMERGGERYGHPFDGDGHVTRFRFEDGEVRYTNRFVRTREWAEEEREERIVYRGFGTNIPGGLWRNALRFRFKNAANTNVVAHGGRLLALWEGGWPHRLDPETLETLERFSFGGKLLNRANPVERLINPELPFSAHPALDPETGELFNFGLVYGARNRLLVYRVDASGALDEPRVIPLDRLSFVHDFVLTKNWCVFLLPEVSFDVARSLLGLVTPVESLRVEPEQPMRALLVPRRGGEPVWIECVSGFVFHFAHGYEDEAGRIVLDGMRLGGFPDLSDFDMLFSARGIPESMPRPWRFVLDPVARSASARRLSPHGAELPRVAEGWSGAHDAFWTTAAPPERAQPFLSSILRVEPERGETCAREFFPDLPGEPIVVPKPGASDPDEGWLLTLVYRAEDHVTDLCILDPRELHTLAVLRLPHHIPPQFHGNFVSAA